MMTLIIAAKETKSLSLRTLILTYTDIPLRDDKKSNLICNISKSNKNLNLGKHIPCGLEVCPIPRRSGAITR